MLIFSEELFQNLTLHKLTTELEAWISWESNLVGHSQKNFGGGQPTYQNAYPIYDQNLSLLYL